MIPIVLFVLAFVVRAAVGVAFPGPAYPDSYYYVHVGEQLAAGHGFMADYIWNFIDVGGRLPADPTLPIPSNAHWMPLAAVIQVPFLLGLGTGALSSGLPFWIVGALAAPLTWFIGRDAGFGVRPAAAAGVMAAVPGGLTPFLSQPDNFGLYMTLGALSLWLCARGMRGKSRSFVLGGLVVGLATLARSDGILLGLPFALIGIRELWRAVRGRPIVLGWAAVIGCAVLFAVAVAPWMYRQWTVFGSFFPSASSGRILWISDYSQLYSISSPVGPETLFANGLGGFLAGRLGGLLSALGLFALMPLVVVLTPFALIGAWVRRRDTPFTPFYIYAVALFAAAGLLFAVHVPYGTFIHSAVALLPHTFLLVTVGLAAVVGWVARRRPTWNAVRATTVFTYGAVAVLLAGAALQTASTLGRWHSNRTVQSELAASLDAAPVADRVMSADAGAYNYLTGRQGIVSPNDPLPVIEDAMRAYNVRWLVLERNAIVPALQPVLAGELQPAWLSSPVAVIPGTGAKPVATAGLGAATAEIQTPPARCTPSACPRPTRGARNDRRDRQVSRRGDQLERRRVADRQVGRCNISWPVRARVRRSRVGRRPVLLPAHRGQRLLRGRGAQPRHGQRLRRRHDLELRDATADPAATGVRAVAADSERCRRHPDGVVRHDLQPRPGGRRLPGRASRSACLARRARHGDSSRPARAPGVVRVRRRGRPGGRRWTLPALNCSSRLIPALHRVWRRGMRRDARGSDRRPPRDRGPRVIAGPGLPDANGSRLAGRGVRCAGGPESALWQLVAAGRSDRRRGRRGRRARRPAVVAAQPRGVRHGIARSGRRQPLPDAQRADLRVP